MRKIRYAKEKTNADRFIGMEGIVIEAIDSAKGVGQVKVGGQVWSAKTEENTFISTEEKIIIIKIEGVKLVVGRKESLCKAQNP